MSPGEMRSKFIEEHPDYKGGNLNSMKRMIGVYEKVNKRKSKSKRKSNQEYLARPEVVIFPTGSKHASNEIEDFEVERTVVCQVLLKDTTTV